MPNDPASGNRDPGAARPELQSLFPPDGAERRRLIGNFDAPEPPPAPARPQRPPDPPPAAAPLPDFMAQSRFTDPAGQSPFDPNEPLARSQHAINLLLYMTTGIAYGLMVSTHWRVSDALNAGGHEHLTLRDGTLAAGLFGQGASGWVDDALLTTGEIFVRQESVVLAAPTEVLPWAEGPRSRDRMWVAKDEYPVVVDAGPYRVYGWVHVPLTKPLAEVLSLRYGRFMPVTNARVRAHPGVRPDDGQRTGGGTQLGLVLVNREHIHVLASIPPPVFPAPAAPAATALPSVEQLNVLTQRCGVFQRETHDFLVRMLAALVQRGMLEGRWFAPGAVIVRQGDQGNTMYVVTAGEVAVEQWHPSEGLREVARLGVGEGFGEGAVVREGRRSASVRSVQGTQVAALHRDGVRWMMDTSPSFAGALEELLLHRRGGGG